MRSEACPVTALISLHDVTPATRPQTDRWLERLEILGLTPVTLLVVPGAGWDEGAIDWLCSLRRAGHELVGHGWRHRVSRIRGWRHRLHSALLSAQVAEHLALDTAGIWNLLVRCYDWFGEHGLDRPVGYVPPAWAMGNITRTALRAAPFHYYETLGGIYDTRRDRWSYLPLAGFEAHSWWQAAALKCSNAIAACWAQRVEPLRIAIHPRDADLRLCRELDRYLQRPMWNLVYRDLYGPTLSVDPASA